MIPRFQVCRPFRRMRTISGWPIGQALGGQQRREEAHLPGYALASPERAINGGKAGERGIRDAAGDTDDQEHGAQSLARVVPSGNIPDITDHGSFHRLI